MFLSRKIKEIYSLAKTIASLKKKNKKIVFTNGCFDLVHYGHVKYLEDAKNNGDILVVGVNSDKSVKAIKGKQRPIIKEEYRIKVIAALESVDFVFLFNEATPLKAINILKPDILVKGADWDKKDIVGADPVKRTGGKVLRISLVKGLSTSKIIEQIAKSRR